MELRCPLCNGPVEIVWRSKDGRTVAVRCNNRHLVIPRKNRLYRPVKPVRGLVFLIEVDKDEKSSVH